MQKILFITPHLSTGGLPQYLYKKLERLSRETKDELFLIEWEDLAPIYRVQKDKIKEIIKTNFISWPQNTDVNKKIHDVITFINTNNFNQIHLEEFPETFLPYELIVSIYYNKSYKITETSHSSDFNITDKKVYPDEFIFVSSSQIEKYKRFNIPSRLEEYVIEDNKRPSRNETLIKLGLDPEYKHVINVGLFTPGKNQGYAFQLARLMEIEKIKFHFRM